ELRREPRQAALASTSSQSGPYLTGLMDLCCNRDIEEITIVKAAQIGVSEALRNVIGYFADKEPDPIIWSCLMSWKGQLFCSAFARNAHQWRGRLAAQRRNRSARSFGTSFPNRSIAASRLPATYVCR